MRNHKWVAVLVGVSLAGSLVFSIMSWLYNQGEPQVSIEANSSIKIAEQIIDEAVTSFDELSIRGIRSCGADDLQILQRVLLASESVTELAVLDQNGQTLCTDRGNIFVARNVIATSVTSNPEIMLDVVRTANSNERLLRVRRLASQGRPSLSALLHVSQLLPRIAPDGTLFSGYARMTLADGSLVGTAGNDPLKDSRQFDETVGRAVSKRYGPIVTVAMARHDVIANYDDLRRIGIVGTYVTAIVILVCTFVVLRWQSKDPISMIQNALLSDEFVPYYQPIIDINSGKLLGAEVLVRWRKSDGTMVEPSFVALIETSDLARDLARVLMRKVCAELGATLGTRPQIYIAFNIAPRHLSDPAIINDVGSIFEASPIRFSQIVFELTERYELEDRDAANRVTAALRSLGIKIALDDFGTGRNGFTHVQKLGVDFIKIDKSFVDTITTARQSQAIATTLTTLARELKLKVIAEGVENFEQVAYLRQYGVNAAQGYVFAPPLPGSAFLELIKALDPRPLHAQTNNLGQVQQSVNCAA